MIRPILELIRLEEDDQWGTFGVLRLCKQIRCFTLEPPDLLNSKSISSIPAQQYTCKQIVSPHFGQTFEITNVPGRTNVLIHAGNSVSDTEGCIIVGETIGKLKAIDRAVLNSGQTFKDLMSELSAYAVIHLTITEAY